MTKASELQVGDVVRLTGPAWFKRYNVAEPNSIVTIDKVSDRAQPRFAWGGHPSEYYVNDSEWGFELVSRAGDDNRPITEAERKAAHDYAKSIGLTGALSLYRKGEVAFYAALAEPTNHYPSTFLRLSGYTTTFKGLDRALTDNAKEIRQVLRDFGVIDKEATVPKTYDTYADELKPLFVKLAQAATDAGYCDEFDRIAAVAGVPKRAELLPSKNKTFWDGLPIGGQFRFSDGGLYTDTTPAVKVTDKSFFALGGVRSIGDHLVKTSYTLDPA